MADSVLDSDQKLKELQARRDDLNSRHAKMSVRAEQAAEELKRVELEMSSVGTSPATIEEDLAKAKLAETQALQLFEAALDVYEKQMIASEQTLTTPLIPSPPT